MKTKHALGEQKIGERASDQGEGVGRKGITFSSLASLPLLLIFFALPPSQFRFFRVSFQKRLQRWLNNRQLLSQASQNALLISDYCCYVFQILY